MGATNYTVFGWNNLGMHCMDSDYSVFCVLPPYNIIRAQLIRGINRTATVVNGGVAISYQSVVDVATSINYDLRRQGQLLRLRRRNFRREPAGRCRPAGARAELLHDAGHERHSTDDGIRGESELVRRLRHPIVPTDDAGNSGASCKPCRGADLNGTAFLTRMQANRSTFSRSFDNGTATRTPWNGTQIGCFGRHNGPGNGQHDLATTHAANRHRVVGFDVHRLARFQRGERQLERALQQRLGHD